MTRFGQVSIKRRKTSPIQTFAQTVQISLIEVCEVNAPAGAEPILWRLLTTHAIEDAAMAWQVINWYRQRWHIEQFFRTLKQQGLQLEDSQLENAERLIKLTASPPAPPARSCNSSRRATACPANKPASPLAPEIETLYALLPEVEGKTALQKNPIHRNRSPGQDGSSPNSADGTAIPSLNRPDQ